MEGLIGIHWRTFETSLTLLALARTAWNESLTVEQLYSDFAVSAFGDTVCSSVRCKLGLPKGSLVRTVGCGTCTCTHRSPLFLG
eukprot:SAG31_NODE_2729_length_5177_cov_2.657542_3_plen_84_part_00